MTIKLATAKSAQPPKTDTSVKIALFYAAIVLVMALGQLFSFEKFVPLIESFGLPGGHGTAALTAALIVILEVFSLPFLLRMKLSPLMRIVSMVFGWLAVAVWLFLVIWVNIQVGSLGNMGIFGASVRVPIGWWGVPYMAALGTLATWASWGLWPIGKRQK